VVLDGRTAGERVTLTKIRARTPRYASSPRVAEVLAALGLLDDDTTPGHPQRLGDLTYRTLRSWLGHRRTAWPRTPTGTS
jgi:hypothetical protein